MIKAAALAFTLALVSSAAIADGYTPPAKTTNAAVFANNGGALGPVTVDLPTANHSGVTVIDTFDKTKLYDYELIGKDSNIASGYTLTGKNTYIMRGSISGFALEPNGDATNYLAVLGGGTATLTMDKPIYSLSVELGSLDSYNYFDFIGTTPSGKAFNETITGTELLVLSGIKTGDSSQLVDFSFNGAKVNEVIFGSTTNSLEIDNIAVATAPEPAAWMLMSAGVGLLGLALRRRRVSTLAIA